jgi:hypothetical protein
MTNNYNRVRERSFVITTNLRGACLSELPAAGHTLAANCRRPGLLDFSSIPLIPFVTLL